MLQKITVILIVVLCTNFIKKTMGLRFADVSCTASDGSCIPITETCNGQEETSTECGAGQKCCRVPHLTVCQYNGHVYFVGEEIPSTEVCKSCRCTFNGTVCEDNCI